MSGDLEAFAPRSVTLRLGGREIEVAPVRLRQIGAWQAFARAAAAALRADDLWQGLAQEADVVLAGLAAVTGHPVEVFEEAPLDDQVAAICAVMRLNADFLAGPVQAALLAGLTRMAPPQSAGERLSPGLSGGATPSATSST